MRARAAQQGGRRRGCHRAAGGRPATRRGRALCWSVGEHSVSEADVLAVALGAPTAQAQTRYRSCSSRALYAQRTSSRSCQRPSRGRCLVRRCKWGLWRAGRLATIRSTCRPRRGLHIDRAAACPPVLALRRVVWCRREGGSTPIGARVLNRLSGRQPPEAAAPALSGRSACGRSGAQVCRPSSTS